MNNQVLHTCVMFIALISIVSPLRCQRQLIIFGSQFADPENCGTSRKCVFNWLFRFFKSIRKLTGSALVSEYSTVYGVEGSLVGREVLGSS